jgi:hypothetical protein
MPVPVRQSSSASAIRPWNERRKPRFTSARARSGDSEGNRSRTRVSQYPPSRSIPEICQYPYSEVARSAPSAARAPPAPAARSP